MSGFLGQLGVKAEATYNTGVTVDRFFEFNSESIAVEVGRVESTGLRAGTRAMRSDRRVPYIMGASGSVDIDVLSKGFGFWLDQALGTVATTGPAETTVYTHTGTVGSLTGKFFTAQVGVPQVGGSTITPKTATGGKVKSFELSCATGEALKFSADLDFANIEHSTSLATASYPESAELLTFVGGSVTVGGTSVAVKKFSVKVDNGLATDRRFLRASATKKEPVEAGVRKIDVELGLDFESTAHQDRILSATAAGAQAAVVLTCAGLTTIGSTLKPTVTVTIPVVMFDGDTPTVGGPDMVEQTVKGVGLYDGTNSPLTIAYKTLDTTP
jgi:Phage tail tube protein